MEWSLYVGYIIDISLFIISFRLVKPMGIIIHQIIQFIIEIQGTGEVKKMSVE